MDTEDDSDDGPLGAFIGEVPDSDADVRRRLHLFQSESVQRSIRRLWDVLPKDEAGTLSMDGYVGLNIRLQRCLSKDFDMAPAVDSAVHDWSEDVAEGQQRMHFEEFAMFLFELCSMWSGPSISLRVYLLFLNAVFISVTAARGTHTVGLREMQDVEVMTEAFFELLSVQGWAKSPEDESSLKEEHAMRAWIESNLSPEAEQTALVQVQRQIFQVTHDVRAILLFRKKGGEPDMLELVKLSSQKLGSVGQVEPRALLGAATSFVGRAPASAELCARPWVPPNHTRAPGRPGPAGLLLGTGAQAVSAAAAVARGAQRRGHSAPRALRSNVLALLGPNSAAAAPRRHLQDVPVGRAYEVVEARRKNLMIGGQFSQTAGTPTASMGIAAASLTAALRQPEYLVAGTGVEDARMTGFEAARPPHFLSAVAAHIAAYHSQDDTAASAGIEGAGSFLDGQAVNPPYTLPHKTAYIYKKQAETALTVTPRTLVFASKKWQAERPLVGEPFARSLRKLSENNRPPSAGPTCGPLAHPNEPVWSEMGQRLQTILRKQGRRAERRRKRKIQSKLFRGRGRREFQSEGAQLREYLDCRAAPGAGGALPSEVDGEFIRKVHERYILNRDLLEAKPFRYRGTGGAVVTTFGIGEAPSRPPPVVRPVYMPPPSEN